ncbi:class II aldolase/adducin domain protein [Fusarium austroafricanum]|uniref:Class II aldolase/adducin domain protein n=1 Tax=Fusarium austroafricanum TaxID=2364996 RepID=A0A8H4KPY7_9HYPO|nr:class II aldolase/adducin domain protein [Fusarium austroafricanum]
MPPKHRSGDPDLAFQPDDQIYPPKFEDKHEERAYLKHRLTLAFRIFANYGFSEGLAGHITVRDPVEPETFWVNPFAAFAIHSEIHKARPDVICAAHSHSTYGRAFCATGRTLDMLSQDFCTFYQDHVLYTNFGGLVFSTDEGKAIAEALSNKKAALLGNHGLLTVAPSIEAAVAWFVLLDKLCEIQLVADASAAGTGKPLVHIGHEEAESAHYAIGRPEGGYFTGLTLFQVVEREFGESTFLGRGVEPL